jgi:hypothetical protein
MATENLNCYEAGFRLPYVWTEPFDLGRIRALPQLPITSTLHHEIVSKLYTKPSSFCTRQAWHAVSSSASTAFKWMGVLHYCFQVKQALSRHNVQMRKQLFSIRFIFAMNLYVQRMQVSKLLLHSTTPKLSSTSNLLENTGRVFSHQRIEGSWAGLRSRTPEIVTLSKLKGECQVFTGTTFNVRQTPEESFITGNLREQQHQQRSDRKQRHRSWSQHRHRWWAIQ